MPANSRWDLIRRLRVKSLFNFPTQCICVFCTDLRTNSDYFPIQHILVGFYNVHGRRSPWGRNWSHISFGWMYSLTRFSHVRFGDASLVAGTRLVERNENDLTQCAIWSFRMKQLEFEVPLKEDLINNCTVGSVWSGASQLVQRYACCLSPCQASSWRQRCWC